MVKASNRSPQDTMFADLAVEGLHRGKTLPLDQEIKLAAALDYPGLEVRLEEVVDLIKRTSTRYVNNLFSDAKIDPSTWELPLEWMGHDSSAEKLARRL